MVTSLVFMYLMVAGSLNGSVANPYDVTPPRNTAVVNGSVATLECAIAGYEGNVVWRDFHTSTDQDIISINRNLFNTHQFSGAFAIEGTYNLKVTASSEMAGKYACGTQDTAVVKYAYLIVSEAETPECDGYPAEQMVEGQETALMCRYGCSGDYRPSLTWYNTNTSQTLPTTIYEEVNTCTVRGLAGFTPDASFDGADIECRVAFGPPQPSVMPSDDDHDQRSPLLTASCTKRLNVLYSVRDVKISLPAQDTYFLPDDVISCSSRGNPSPGITWILLAGNATSGNVSENSLTITSDMVGYNKYACVATNVIGGVPYTSQQETEFYVQDVAKTPNRSNVGAIVGGVIGGLLAVGLIAGVAFFIVSTRKRASQKDAASNRMDSMTSRKILNDYMLTKPIQFINKHVLRRPESSAGGNQDVEGSIGAVSPWEVPRENLNLVKKLGEGSFGQVWKCEAWKLPQLGGTAFVAVKMLKENASDKDKTDLLSELDVMKNLPAHPNVVSLLGCCTGKDPIMIVVEFLACGNLKDHLKNKRAQSRAEQDYMSESDVTTDVVGPRDLIFFAYQSAKGMAHIAKHNLLHRDLAARNILVGDGGVCKVSDFGFARDVIDRNVYHRESQGPLPIRWMAPESIYDNSYTSQSDVWSFGVLLWEIVTMGANPYPGMSGRDVMDMVRRGKRMERPEHCTEEVYDVMTGCWREDPDERPTFDKLSAMLDSMLQEESDYLCLDDLQDDLYENAAVIQGTDERI